MGICDSVDIFQVIVDQILGAIDYVKTYINDVLVLRKDRFFNYV